MGFLVSPGVEVKEIDLTNVIPALSTSIGGFAGTFKWGPVDELITVSSEDDLRQIFGKPDATVSKSFLQAAGFLKYGNTLKVSRAVKEDSTGVNIVTTANAAETVSASAGARGTGLSSTGSGTTQATGRILVKNLTDFYATYTSLSTSATFISRCPGEFGNSLQVIVTTGAIASGESSFADVSGETNTNAIKATLRANFDAAPGSLNSNDTIDALNDEIHVLIIDRLGKISGTPNNVIEKFQGLSLLKDSKEADGSSNYYFDVINNQSQFVFVNKLGNATNGLFTGADTTIDASDAALTSNTDDTADGDMATGNGGFRDGVYIEAFTNGQDGDPTAGSYKNAIDLFEDADTVDVNLLMAAAGYLSSSDQVEVDNDLIACASNRKDAVAFVSAPVEGTDGVHLQTTEAGKLEKVLARRNLLTGLNSYSVMDSSPLYVYNKFADNFEFIAASGHIAGLCARTDGTNDPWFSPAGFNRGNLVGVTKLAFNPNQSSRDSLYKAQVNPIAAFPGQGIVLFGDKTGQVKASAFDRINVRRLFIVLEKAISTASKFSLFELNDEFTRAQFRNLVEPFLRDVKGRRGITDFLVVCDETNNTGQVIDTNRFVADIFIKPARSINFITLNFIATRTGVEFSELTN